MSAQTISEHHELDRHGNPDGGTTIGRGIELHWQQGPLMVDGVRREANGCFVEAVIQAAIGRLEHYQASRFACDQNADALAYLGAALEALRERTAKREARGVEGTHVP